MSDHHVGGLNTRPIPVKVEGGVSLGIVIRLDSETREWLTRLAVLIARPAITPYMRQGLVNEVLGTPQDRTNE